MLDGRSFQLHVANVVASLDDDPTVQMYFQYFLVLGNLKVQIPGVRLFRRVRFQQTQAVGVPAPNRRAVDVKKAFEFLIKRLRISSEIEERLSLLGQLFGQLGDLARNLPILGVVELWDAAICRGAGC